MTAPQHLKDRPLGLWSALILLLASTIVPPVLPSTAAAQAKPTSSKTSDTPTTLCIRLDLYAQADQPSSQAAQEELDRFVSERPEVSYRLYHVDGEANAAQRQRVAQICRFFQLTEQTPLVYGCGRPVLGFKDAASFRQQLQELITITIFVRQGCPHCADAKAYLPQLRRRFPGFAVRLKDAVSDASARQEMQELIRKHRTSAASLPVFHACNELVIGFDSAATTGARLETILKRWTRDCAPKEKAPPEPSGTRSSPRVRLVSHADASEQSGDDTALPLPPEAELPLPGVNAPADESALQESPPTGAIHLPFFGDLRVEQIGMPLFTVAVGLVDGFNPCAMWVLMFLLSILVNLRSRARILAVAGTFVLISGAAYFAFMAAWLNVFLLLGLLTWVRLTLASLAIVMGLIHVKDFFAFKRGITLSIPESAKPGIYQRVRRIVTAENLTGAVLGAAVLAVLVNIIELLCTAGLPALYTQILSAQQFPWWKNYAYLFLYILAYMADDSLMVGLVVVTLQRHKLQETHGRWLKLISGLAILVLGTIMLLRPEWIGMSA